MTVIFPIITLFLLLAFYFGLPDLSLCPLPEQNGDSRRVDFRDVLLMLLISLVYAAVAFYNLGSRTDPQTFYEPRGDISPVFVLSEEIDGGSVMLYSGIGIGMVDVEASADNENYFSLGSIDLNYAAVLKWHSLSIPAGMSVNYIRLVCSSGMPSVGELGINASRPVALSGGVPSLLDEQSTVPLKSDFSNSSYFDEIYHARTAYEHLKGISPYEITHPPLGKLILSLGIMLFGLTPFGWRFSGTLFGVLMLPVLYVFAKKLFGGRRVPAVCTIVFAADFMHFVQTRIATIDTYAVFFILLMYLFMWLYISRDGGHSTLWLFFCGLFFGLGAASKWTCFYAGAGLALIWAVHWLGRGREEGLRAFLKNCAQCVLFFILIPALIYYLSYYPYGKAQGMEGLAMYLEPRYLKTVLYNQSYMFRYHSGIEATHPYASRWYQWVFNIRPILYYLEYGANGARSSFGAWVSPMLCWGGLFSLFVLIFTALFRGDRSAAFILTGYAAQLVPWMFVTRITFEYHYFPCTVFLALSLGYVCSLLKMGDRHYKWRIYGFAVVSIAVFILFYPALSGAWINEAQAAKLLAWLPTWPF